jgi:uncharacterized protein (DUF1697 family)
MAAFVALLRGINVGGANRIAMADLRACFEADGFRDVATYIQSGNVVFQTPEPSAAALTRRLEAMLSAGLGYPASVVVRSRAQMRTIVQKAPAGFGSDLDRYRCDVIFLKPPLRADAAGRGRGVGRAGRALLLAAGQPRQPEPAQQHRRQPHLRQRHHPQLEHDHPADADAGGAAARLAAAAPKADQPPPPRPWLGEPQVEVDQVADHPPADLVDAGRVAR